MYLSLHETIEAFLHFNHLNQLFTLDVFWFSLCFSIILNNYCKIFKPCNLWYSLHFLPKLEVLLLLLNFSYISFYFHSNKITSYKTCLQISKLTFISSLNSLTKNILLSAKCMHRSASSLCFVNTSMPCPTIELWPCFTPTVNNTLCSITYNKMGAKYDFSRVSRDIYLMSASGFQLPLNQCTATPSKYLNYFIPADSN